MNFAFLVLVILIVTIDNAILCGLLLPNTSKTVQLEIATMVGTALGAAQGPIAVGIGPLLNNQSFRIGSIIILGWMCIVALKKPQSRTKIDTLRVTSTVFIFCLFGNIGNMLWLGAIHKGSYWVLILLSICAVPVFVVVTLFLCRQAEKYHWVSFMGATLMAWIAGELYTGTPIARTMSSTVPPVVMQGLFAALLMVLALAISRQKEIH